MSEIQKKFISSGMNPLVIIEEFENLIKNNTGILCDKDIEEICTNSNVIEPFVNHSVKTRIKATITGEEVEEKIISYGLSSFGYDIRLGNQFKIFNNLNSEIVDPKKLNDAYFIEKYVADFSSIVIPPNSYMLGVSKEKFNIPRNIVTVAIGKSTYARAGIIVNVTPFEPEWCGHATLEISNNTPSPVKVYAGEGILQLLCFRGNPCRISYADKAGKYQNQENKIVLPRM